MKSGLSKHAYTLLKALADAPQHTMLVTKLRVLVEPMSYAAFNTGLTRLVNWKLATLSPAGVTLTEKGKARILMSDTPASKPKRGRHLNALEMVDLRISQALELSNRHHDAGRADQATHWAGVAAGYTEAREIMVGELRRLLSKRRAGTLITGDFPLPETARVEPY